MYLYEVICVSVYLNFRLQLGIVCDDRLQIFRVAPWRPRDCLGAKLGVSVMGRETINNFVARRLRSKACSANVVIFGA